MKRITSIVICNIVFFNTLFCSYVDTTFAKIVAKNFYLSRVSSGNPLQFKSFTTQGVYLQLAYQEFDGSHDSVSLKTSQNHPLYYVFNINDKGFIIVSADDEVKPILGYSHTGKFSLNDQPPAFIAWMNRYKEQIKYLKKNALKGTGTVLDEWTKYSGSIITESDITLAETGPMLSTTWEQGCYYNEYCPVDSRGPCYRVWVGCGATAMGQIMKYWEYPIACNNIPGYYDGTNYDTDGTPLPNTVYRIPDVISSSYDWSNMPDSLSSGSSYIQKSEVSKLLFHCGIAAIMNYGPYNSGAVVDDVVSALIHYFKYSTSAQLLWKVNYVDTDWKNLLISELDNNRPIYYIGYGSGSHAFVCDGYQGPDYFHFNWGWGGVYDGYFYLNDLTPGNSEILDYTEQGAIIGICPGQETNDSIKLTEKTKITLSPNPTSNKIYLKPNSDLDSETSILLFDCSGQLVYANSIDKIMTNESFEIDIASFKNGVYILQLTNPKCKIIEKVIKQ